MEGIEETGLSRRVEIHDRNQLELKLGYTLDPRQKSEVYRIETHIFLPRTLGIESHNYSGQNFYGDTAAFLRFKTPRVAMSELADRRAAMLWFDCLELGNADESQDSLRVLGCVFRAALRDAASPLRSMARTLRFASPARIEYEAERLIGALDDFLADFSAAHERWKELGRECQDELHVDDVRHTFHIVDEYIALVAEDVITGVVKKVDKTVRRLKQRDWVLSSLELARERVARRCVKLAQYGRRCGHAQVLPHADDDDDDEDDLDANNELFPYRRRLLKRSVFNPLYLEIRGARVVRVAHNVVGMVAAALAMMFALSMALWSQVTWGMLTWPFVLIAIVSYMIKDRIKEWGKSYLARRFKRFFPDHAHLIHAPDGTELGVLEERFEFKEPSACDEDVLGVRYPERPPGQPPIRLPSQQRRAPAKVGRATKAAMRASDAWRPSRAAQGNSQLGRDARPEVVLGYTKQVTLRRWSEEGADRFSDRFIGVNDIIRFNLGRFRARMDDPDESYLRVDPETLKLVNVDTSRVYHVNVVLKFTLGEGEDQTTSLERLRLVMDQRGIKRVEEPF